jgi:trehalose 6-phosphate synthase/phosphatase
MNLVAKEYVACKREGSGALVLSEFAGAAEELFNALIVNPYDARALAEALATAVAMPDAERRERMRPMRERVMQFDARAWAKSFIDDLANRRPRAAAAGGAAEAGRRIREALATGGGAALFLDYDGTLREIVRDPSAAGPTPAVRALLERLARRAPDVNATIVSGRTQHDLEGWLGEYPFGLIAEHGAAIRRPGRRQWERLDRNVRYEWKEPLLRILRHYEASTPGSFVEQKRTSLVWHYRSADPEFGAWKANALAAELGVLLANDPVQIRHGKKIVEITAAGINKGAAVGRVLEDHAYDVVVCAGDDATDESMFTMGGDNVISIKVGEGDTRAAFTIPTPAAFRAMLTDAIGP